MVFAAKDVFKALRRIISGSFFTIQIFLNMMFDNLTLIHEFFRPSPSAFSEKKFRIIAGDVTFGT